MGVLNLVRGGFQRLRDIVVEFAADDCGVQSAAVSYYALTSLFPALLLLVAGLSRFMAAPVAQQEVADLLGSYLPVPHLQEYVAQNVKGTLQWRGIMAVVGFVGLLWTAKGLFLSLEHGLNAVWRLPRRRATWWTYLVSVLTTIGVGLALTAQFAATAAAHAILGRTWHLQSLALVTTYITWLISLLCLFGILCLLYAALPTQRMPFAVIWRGALLATVLWKLVEYLFIAYIRYAITTVAALYGTASVILALMLWFYLSSTIFFVGAEYIYLGLVKRGVLSDKMPRFSLSARQKEV